MTDRDVSDGDRLLTVDDIAERLTLSTETVRRMLRDGRLRGIRLGERRAGWRVSESDLHAFIEDRRKTTETAR